MQLFLPVLYSTPTLTTCTSGNLISAIQGNAASRQITVKINDAITVGNVTTLTFPEGWGSVNPSSPGSYTLSIATADASNNVIEAAVSSPSYTIGLLTAVNVYNGSGNLVASPTDLQTALTDITANNYTVKLGAATYSAPSTTTPAYTYTVPAFSGLTITSADGNAADTIIGKPYSSTNTTPTTFVITGGAANGDYVTISNLTFVGKVVNNGTYVTFNKCVFNQAGGSGFTPLFTNTTQGLHVDANYLTISNSTFDTTTNGGNTNGTTTAIAINDLGPLTKNNDSITQNTFKIGQNSSLQQDVAIESGAGVNVAVIMNTFTGVGGGIGYECITGADNLVPLLPLTILSSPTPSPEFRLH